MIKRQALALIIVGVLILLSTFFILFKSQNTLPQEKMLEVEPSVTSIEPIGEEAIDEDSSDEESQELMDSENSYSDVQDEDVILEEEIVE